MVTEVNYENFSQNTRFPDRDSIQAPSGHKFSFLPLN
jgi:hypothetical protein